MPTSNDFIAAARSYMGVKWRHQGRNQMGVDCVGLVLCCLDEIGIPAPDMQGYRRTPDPIFVEHIRNNSLSSTTTDPGMLGIFRDGTQPCHVGIFATMYGQTSLIHAYAGTGIVMEEVFIHDWPNKLVEVRAFKGLEYI
jgi:cell wall-associated NlpC family hydrolase